MKIYLVEAEETVGNRDYSWVPVTKSSYDSALDYVRNYKIDLNYIMEDELFIHDEKYKNLEIVKDEFNEKYGERTIRVRCRAEEYEPNITYTNTENGKIYYTFYDYDLTLRVEEKELGS